MIAAATRPAFSEPPELAAISIRPLTADDAFAFRALRLEAVKRDGRYFATSYEAEATRPLAGWRELCAEVNRRCVLGVFDQGRLVGISALEPWSGDATGASVLLRSSYITPAYRGRGLAKPLFATRLQWAAAHDYRRAVLFIREGNAASTGLHEQFGARPWFTKPMQWADGKTAPAHWYQIDLAEPVAALRRVEPGSPLRPCDQIEPPSCVPIHSRA